eukprot:6183498-Pleurochrysis_carterae.AAC.2
MSYKLVCLKGTCCAEGCAEGCVVSLDCVHLTSMLSPCLVARARCGLHACSMVRSVLVHVDMCPASGSAFVTVYACVPVHEPRRGCARLRCCGVARECTRASMRVQLG